MSSASATFTRFANNLGRKFEPDVRHHLARVYTCLGATTACAAIGAILHMTSVLQAGLLVGLGSFILIIALHFTKDNGKNFYMRLAMLLAFGFCCGQTLGPLLLHIRYLNPQIIVSALTGTTIVFISLTLSALLAERGQFLFLGGLLVSIINTMLLFSLLNFFVRSYFVQQAQLYIGLGVMSAFILYDTQNIIERSRLGDKDCIQHSLDLFFNVINIFRRLLIILAQKEENSRQNKKKQ